jgi:hypothetical protein
LRGSTSDPRTVTNTFAICREIFLHSKKNHTKSANVMLYRHKSGGENAGKIKKNENEVQKEKKL